MMSGTASKAARVAGAPALVGPGAPAATRRYIYCVIDGDTTGGFDPQGIDGVGAVFGVCHEGLVAVVSPTAAEKLEISRGNALAHQRVMEAIMQRGHTVLPVRFNTIAEDKGAKTAEERIVDQVLVARKEEIRGLLTTMRPLVEMGVKGQWPNMEAVFGEIVQKSAGIQRVRKRLLGAGRPGAGRGLAGASGQIELGSMVKRALEASKGESATALAGRLKPLTVELRRNKTFGDAMFANLALLVDKAQQDRVGAALAAFEAEQAGGVKLWYVGPLPASNFLELTISWDD